MAATKITPADNVLALEQQVCFALAVAARTVIALYRPVLEPMGLTHPQYLVMLALWEFEPVSVKDLSGMLQLEPATLSPLLKRLEAAGLLRRDRSAADERSLAVVLTDEGRALRDQALEVPPAIVERLGMDVDELMDLHGRLTRVIAAATDGRSSGGRRGRAVDGQT
ncbi:MarR family winged helix-turn-helix transcriptional regulator [Kribbella kalugense]|uniref:DNA-binding MarR family transcriptional regulator n=1 Tax=Kribbella kalugense TaxID=2512221 RepID=A0A4R7ZZW6_9ACTN|nr:MarR family transcriptional regulator [Kribbella kalugense]TDW21340.1 DNA-binding MarR family transcriptional regulator [Kribbella kalugense]